MTTAAVHVTVLASVAARSVTYSTTEAIRVLSAIAHERGLSLDYMYYQHKILTDGIRVWMSGRWLKALTLEIYDPRSDALIERYDLQIDYSTPRPGEERYKTHMEKVEKLFTTTKQLPSHYLYRVLADLTHGAPKLPNWQSSAYRDTSNLSKTAIGDVIETSAVGMKMQTWFQQERSTP